MTAVLPGPPTLAEVRARRVLPSMTDPAWDEPLAAAVLAASLGKDAQCAGCDVLLIKHSGPLFQGEGPYRGLFYGSVDCCGGPGAPGSREALLDSYGTADPVLLRDRFALPEEIAAAEWHANSGQAAA